MLTRYQSLGGVGCRWESLSERSLAARALKDPSEGQRDSGGRQMGGTGEQKERSDRGKLTGNKRLLEGTILSIRRLMMRSDHLEEAGVVEKRNAEEGRVGVGLSWGNKRLIRFGEKDPEVIKLNIIESQAWDELTGEERTDKEEPSL